MYKKTNKNNQQGQTLSCHPELVSGSICGSAWRVGNTLNGSCLRANGFRTKSGMTDECGRSMVEMLGILAIIGVLSVGGISGYTTTMNKHKANEILNAAAVRAMAVSTQLQSGVTDPTLGEFDSSENIGGATFTGVDKVGENQFRLNFGDQPSPAVLSQMQNIAGDNVGVNGSRLLYNNDLSSGVDGKNTNKDEDGNCIDSYGLDCETSCPTGTGTDRTTYKGTEVNSTGCYCKNSGEVWGGTEQKCESTGPVFKVVRNGGYTQPGAQAACAELGSGWRLASAVDIGCGYGDNCETTLKGLTYTSDADAWNSEYVYLADCCEPDEWLEFCSHTVTCPSGVSGYAWFFDEDGFGRFYDRVDQDRYHALCVLD